MAKSAFLAEQRRSKLHLGLVDEAARELEQTGLSVACYDMRFLKPIDEELLHNILGKFDKIITVEDGTVVGGLGSAVLEFMADHRYKADLKRLGVPDRFVDQGTQQELYQECGYDKEGIKNAVREITGK